MPYDYSALSGEINRQFGTRYNFAKSMGLSERSLSLKMTGKVDWRQKEIQRACQILGIADQDVVRFFFTLKVQH